MEKKLDGNYTRMLRAILNESRRQHPTKQRLYGHQTPITKTIQVTRTRHTGHCWRSRDELISDVLLWTPSHEQAKAGRPARTYIQKFCADTGCSLEDLPEAMDDWEGWRKKGQGYPYWWRVMMMMVMTMFNLRNSPPNNQYILLTVTPADCHKRFRNKLVFGEHIW